jgi:hypothetical protein
LRRKSPSPKIDTERRFTRSTKVNEVLNDTPGIRPSQKRKVPAMAKKAPAKAAKGKAGKAGKASKSSKSAASSKGGSSGG